jgi:cellulose synthase/poly-beta-1,6-N-acetylglucosamine synthase-like glycosyltransferase
VNSAFSFAQNFPLLILFWGLKILLLFVFSHRVQLYISSRKKKSISSHDVAVPQNIFSTPPLVCVQIPLFNESGHIFELLNSIGKQNWPNFEVQVLDDSTDTTCFEETVLAVEQAQKHFPQLSICLLTRKNRKGFKAGALNFGMEFSKADFFAVFDCDFRPEPHFINFMMHKFLEDKHCAAVQAPWSFYNESENIITCMQSLLLGNHFHVEHLGRENKQWFVNFNGTAGIWKRTELEKLGGWSPQTVTEDLHLSLRSHLAGSRIRYVPELACPSELPSSVNAFLVQQRRWAKGHGQVLRLMFSEILRNKIWNIFQKHDAVAHLTSYLVSSVFFMAIFLLPFWIPQNANWVANSSATSALRLFDLALWLVFFSCLWFYYLLPAISPKSKFSFRLKGCWGIAHAAPYLSILVFPSFFVGLFSKHTKNLVFHRTPKRNKAVYLVGGAFKWFFKLDNFCILALFIHLTYCAWIALENKSYFTFILVFLNLIFSVNFTIINIWKNKIVEKSFSQKHFDCDLTPLKTIERGATYEPR